ncbi:hypothetical protein [Acinetobacter pittii]|uniref:hypothetical protein n=1 Tax=Acinetobacter pittii TaxID=48296 RepID=UPI001F1FC3D2|nr:hypothetical protein [Acinetobacter pittii]MCE6001999.1 hypothetical protein [Acinetobacter pittii]
MVQEYVVAHIKSGKAIQQADVQDYCSLAADVKAAAKKTQKAIVEDARRRTW